MKEINSPKLVSMKKEVIIGNRKREVFLIGRPSDMKNISSTKARDSKPPKVYRKRVVGGCGGCSRQKGRARKRG